jgi:antitoxin ParD1/3/4
MNISLTPELEKMVEEKVKTGRYTSASEVVREALRLFSDYEEARQRGILELNRKIEEGLAQASRGEFITGEDSRRRTRAVRSKLAPKT